MRYGTIVYTLRRPVTLTLVVERMEVELSLLVLKGYVFNAYGSNTNLLHAKRSTNYVSHASVSNSKTEMKTTA